MKNIKLLVLDMDGVVNSDQLIHSWFDEKFKSVEAEFDYIQDSDAVRRRVRQQFADEFCNSTELIFPQLAKRIMQICNETDCLILWSSTWRMLSKYSDIEIAKDMFNRRGLPGERLVGYTPSFTHFDDGCRGNEIRSWILNNTIGNVVRAAIVDDRFDAGVGLPDCACFFQTRIEEGITEKHVSDIINFLNNGVKPQYD